MYTGYKRTAHDIAKSYVNKLDNTKEKHILKILNYVKEGEKILRSGDLNDFGRLLHDSWLEKKRLSSSISNFSIDNIYNQALKSGSLGGKLLGAGGGGFFLFFVPPQNQKSFLKKMNYLTNVPFKFSFKGSKILFNNKIRQS